MQAIRFEFLHWVKKLRSAEQLRSSTQGQGSASMSVTGGCLDWNSCLTA